MRGLFAFSGGARLYLSLIGATPTTFLLWTPNGSIQVTASLTFGEMLLALLLTLVVVLQVWSWWARRADDWLDGM